jgi:hypothetical protein
LRQSALYFVFLALYVGSSVYSRDGESVFYFTRTLRRELLHGPFEATSVPNYGKVLADTATIDDVWLFLEGPVMRTVFPDQVGG